jgi:uncharacterized protein with PQ loop repeat
MFEVIHHLHKRKRVYKKMEPYPHPRPGVRFLDWSIMVIAAAAPLANVMQAAKVYQQQSAGDLSLVTWGLLTVFNVVWIAYGVVHKEKPIIMGYVLWLISNGAVVLGILLYS